MRKLFTSLCVAVLTVVGAASAWAQTVVYEKGNKVHAENLQNGDYVTIQAVNKTTNSGFFGGAGPLSPTFRGDGTTVYQIVKKEGESTISFKRAGTNEYLQNPSANRTDIVFVSDESKAAKMTVHKADGQDGKDSWSKHAGDLIDNVEHDYLYRFYIGDKILNCQRSDWNAKWMPGQGGWTVFYVWKVTTVNAARYTYNYKIDGVKVLEETHVTKLGGSFAEPLSPVGTTGATQTIPSSNVAAEHDNQSFDVDFTLPFEKHASYDANSNFFYTFSIRENNKNVVWNDALKQFENKVVQNTFFVDEQLFQFVGDMTSGFRIYSKKTGLPLGGAITNQGAITPGGTPEGVYTLLIGQKDNTTGFVFREKSSTNGYFHDHTNKLAYWTSDAGLNDKGSFVYFYKVNVKDEKVLYENEKTRFNTYRFADEFGAYKLNSAYHAAKQEIDKITAKEQQGAATVSQDEYRTGKEKILAAIANLELYTPSDRSFLRIEPLFNRGTSRLTYISGKSFDGNDFSGANISGHLSQELTTESLNTIFYYNNKKLVCVGTGKTITLSEGKLLVGDYKQEGTDVVFGKSESGKYTLSFGEKFLNANAALDYAFGGENADGKNGEFMLSSVPALPLEIKEIGYASFYTPVAVTVEDGYVAYKAASNPSKAGELVLTELSKTIPANTAFIVKGEPNTVCTLTIVDNGGATVEGNALVGDVVTKTAGTGSYSLTKKGANEAVFGKLSAEVKQIAFRAFYINNTVNPVNEMSFSFKTTLTGVASLKGNNEAAPLYDLSGRRVLSPAKGGIYIQNGQKVIAQ